MLLALLKNRTYTPSHLLSYSPFSHFCNRVTLKTARAPSTNRLQTPKGTIKGIDPKIQEAITNEILDRSPSVTFDDIGTFLTVLCACRANNSLFFSGA